MSKWKQDEVQFPRLLAEINAVGLSLEQIDGLCRSMDITPDELAELFERAERAFAALKPS